MKKKKSKLKKKRTLKKKKKKGVPAEVRTRGKWYRRQSPYTMSHANIAYQAIKFTIYTESVTITVNTNQACFRRFFAINSPRTST